MERRGTNTWIVAVLAVAAGFLIALLIFGTDDNNNTSATVDTTTEQTSTAPATTTGTTTSTDGATTTSTTTTTPTASSPTDKVPTLDSCIALWNQSNNKTNQAFLVGLIAKQPVRVHVGLTSEVPPSCQITIVANNGDAYVFPEGGGTTYPYAQAPGTTPSSSLPATQKTSNALEQSDGTLKSR